MGEDGAVGGVTSIGNGAPSDDDSITANFGSDGGEAVTAVGSAQDDPADSGQITAARWFGRHPEQIARSAGMKISWKYSLSFTSWSLAAFYLPTLMAHPLIHPYLRGEAFYVVELCLVAIIVLVAEPAFRGGALLKLSVAAILGYFVGLVSYLIKWAFFDKHTNSPSHLAQVLDGIFSVSPWLFAVFTYCWLLLPVATLIGRWLTARLLHTKLVL